MMSVQIDFSVHSTVYTAIAKGHKPVSVSIEDPINNYKDCSITSSNS